MTDRAPDLFARAVELDAEERATLLAEECADDSHLKAQVERLLCAYNESVRIRPARDDDRSRIYQLRHAVYAEELGQHPVNDQGMLRDALDDYNYYLIVENDQELIGCISVTPPPKASKGSAVLDHKYSIDKYLDRNELPLGVTLVFPSRGSFHGFNEFCGKQLPASLPAIALE